MKILLTGGAGFIGSALARHLLDTPGVEGVVNLDLLTYAGNLENPADPRACDSGTFRGKSMILGGRAPVRAAPYLSVWSASRWNPGRSEGKTQRGMATQW